MHVPANAFTLQAVLTQQDMQQSAIKSSEEENRKLVYTDVNNSGFKETHSTHFRPQIDTVIENYTGHLKYLC